MCHLEVLYILVYFFGLSYSSANVLILWRKFRNASTSYSLGSTVVLKYVNCFIKIWDLCAQRSLSQIHYLHSWLFAYVIIVDSNLFSGDRNTLAMYGDPGKLSITHRRHSYINRFLEMICIANETRSKQGRHIKMTRNLMYYTSEVVFLQFNSSICMYIEVNSTYIYVESSAWP